MIYYDFNIKNNHDYCLIFIFFPSPLPTPSCFEGQEYGEQSIKIEWPYVFHEFIDGLLQKGDIEI